MLVDVARLGPFFSISMDPAESADPTWRPLRELHADPEPLRSHIAHVRRVLGSDWRVAASIAFQGLAARIVSAPFAASVLHGVMPDMAVVHWRRATSGPWPLWCGEPDGVTADVARVLDEHVRPLAAAVRGHVAIAERVLWGNVASSVASAAAQVAAARPAAAGEAFALLRRLLGDGPLAGSGELRADGAFRRRSCCLYYRVPGGGLCGDCVLQPR